MLKRIAILLFFVQVSSAQDYGNDVDTMKLCASLQGNSLINDVEADNALNRILDVIGASVRLGWSKYNQISLYCD